MFGGFRDSLNQLLWYGRITLVETLLDRMSGMGGLSENQARPIFQQIMEGLRVLHGKGFCHNDLCVFDRNDEVVLVNLDMCLRVPIDERGPLGLIAR